MKTKTIFEGLLVICVIGACAPSTPISIAETVAVPTLSVNNTSVPTPVATATSLTANWESAKRCVTEYSQQPEETQLEGVAVLRSLSSTVLGMELSLLDLMDGTPKNIDTANQSIWNVEVSPDRHTLAYVWFNNSTEEWELVFTDTLGNLQKTAWSSKQGFFFQDWLNDQQLVIQQDLKYLIVDPYLDTVVSFSPSDFPDFDVYNSKSLLSFDPRLSRAIYKAGSNINIFDLDAKTVNSRLLDGYDRVPIIRWFNSGEKAAIVSTVSPEQKLDSFGLPDEIFIVEKDGQGRQLTHLFDTFGFPLAIHNLTWSPDSRKIAFWLDDIEADLTLFVADSETGKAVNYCVTNVWNARFPIGVASPIWSPDGKYLMVENRYATDKNRVLVIDLSKNSSFPIAENANPVGWMAEKP